MPEPTATAQSLLPGRILREASSLLELYRGDVKEAADHAWRGWVESHGDSPEWRTYWLRVAVTLGSAAGGAK